MATKTLDVKGGNKLAAALREIAARLGSGDAGVKVGFLEGATYPATHSPNSATPDIAGLPVAQVAFWNEFGTVRAPPRPFFRSAIAQHQGEWGGQLAHALRSTGMDARRALTIMGEVIKDEIVTSIVNTNAPPLAESTVRRKGFDKPLIDTGVMQRSVDYVVTA